MKKTLFIKLAEYLRENHPEILSALADDNAIASYINDRLQSIAGNLQDLQNQQKPEYIIEELCMRQLTEDLGPSKYLFIKTILEEEFLIEYHHLLQLGILHFEIMNILSNCDPLFEAFQFSRDNEQDKNLSYTIIGAIKEYFEKTVRRDRALWPTMPTISL